MTPKKQSSPHTLSTEPYKGVRDFYPYDAAVQQYLFTTWSGTAERFGFERYDASLLEPSELYKNKGAENEEMVDGQTYTFSDRGGREVTLRPEMTPTVARMVARKRRELHFPLRWYCVANMFRYERPQRGRLREHWQLNCDIFGATHYAADVEILALASRVLLDFGATSEQFSLHINNRALMERSVTGALKRPEFLGAYLRLIDQKHKLAPEVFAKEEAALLKEKAAVTIAPDRSVLDILEGLRMLGIHNAHFDPTIVRGFNYYTGTVFEVFDTSRENRRALLGGGRYDNLTRMFGGEPISGVGFGMGDVTMRDFLETHALLPEQLAAAARVAVVPTDDTYNMPAGALAARLREAGIHAAVHFGEQKLGKKMARVAQSKAAYAIVYGSDEAASTTYTLKRLADGTQTTGLSAEQIITTLVSHR